jgi:N4-gp56 family major capsid protein
VDRIELSDVCKDTHEDPVLQEAIELLGEQAPIILEKARFLILRAGTNVVCG